MPSRKPVIANAARQSPEGKHAARRLLRCARNDGMGCFLIALLWLPCGSAHATDRVWLVGGGYDLQNSQVQIEQNVLWSRTVLQALPGERSITTYFNDGTDPAPDVLLWQPPAETAATLQPLARVYDAYFVNGESTRSHSITPVDGPATRERLLDALPAQIQALRPGEQGLFVYAGHGSPADSGSQLDLWGDAKLTAAELRELLTAQPRDTRLRFIFTQCFAGGFHAAILPQASEPERCGFYAVAEDQYAEGCMATLEVAEYRGYGTYFFAALSGKTRTGDALPHVPDRNEDGRVDAYEAHLYTLRAGHSTDLPRSSSEQFLLDWAPWYAPLLRVAPQADNPYAEIAQGLIEDLAISGSTRDALYTLRQQARREIGNLSRRQSQSAARAARVMEELRGELEARWPALAYPYTLAYAQFIKHDLAAAQAYILAHPRYPELVREQDAYWAQEQAMLALQRQLSLYERIEYLQRLARLRELFLWRAEAAEQASYQRLLSCEQQPL